MMKNQHLSMYNIQFEKYAWYVSEQKHTQNNVIFRNFSVHLSIHRNERNHFDMKEILIFTFLDDLLNCFFCCFLYKCLVELANNPTIVNKQKNANNLACSCDINKLVLKATT